MKKLNIFISAIFVSIWVLLASCYTPSPIYGTWADNSGSKITFTDDGSYTATIVTQAEDGQIKTNYSGDWSVIDNVIVFTKDSGGSINSEWDIRGSMLYLDWTDDEGTKQALTLYHVSK